jgi:phospholipid/cholesterol/gamma-HCH transport system ATP-binding protein
MARVAVENLGKRFGAIEALKDVSLSLDAGRSMALIGPTAAGKSVLLKCLVGLYAPDAGRILIDRTEVGVTDERPSELNDRIGMLFQQNALFDSLPVGKISPFG